MKLANGLKIAAEVPVALLVAFLLFMGIGETISGDPSGIIAHLLPALVVGVLMWFAWKRPLYAGIILVILGLISLVSFGSAISRRQEEYVGILIMVTPLLLTGLLLLLAAWKTPKATV